MRYSLIATVLLGSALAIPHEKYYPRPCRRHEKDCHPLSYLAGSAAPIVTGTATPEGSTYYETTTELSSEVLNDDHGSSALPLESSPEMPPPLGEKHAKKPADNCDANTVTVTAKATVTVTVSPGEASSPSIPASPSSTSAPQTLPSPEVRAAESTPEDASGDDEEEAPADTSSTPTTSSPQPEKKAEEAPPATSSTPADTTTEDTTAEDTTPKETTPKDISPAAAAGTAPFKSKRGIIASGSSTDALASAFGNTKVSWLGNWFSGPPKALSPSLTFVPQNYGKQSDIKGEWTANAKKAVANGAKYFLSFGEPGTPNDKLHLEPNEAVDLWREKMEPYAKQGVTLGAPGTLQNTQDFDWLDKFLTACTGCSIGFLAQHWFDKAGAKQVPGFKETLGKTRALAEKHGVKGVWLDNFSAKGSAEEQKAFLGEVVPWLDSQDWVQAYAYVPPEVGKEGDGANMVDGGGQLNELGKYYANL